MSTVINLKNKTDLARLRRMTVAAQGLHKAGGIGRGLSGTVRATEQIGYVQLDTISVVERAHHHVLHSRVPNYQPAFANKLLRQRKIFEYWAHAAAFLPLSAYRYTLPFKALVRAGEVGWFRNQKLPLMGEMLDHIAKHGALRARDTDAVTDQSNHRQSNSEGWWDWKPAKKALERLYMQGDLMVTERSGFQKSYDLPERVLPASTDTSVPDYAEYAEWLLSQNLRSHGFVTTAQATYLRRDKALRNAMKDTLDTQVQSGDLVAFKIKDKGPYFAPAHLMEPGTRAPRCAPVMHILSPFDNLVIQRDRGQTLFDFDYQIECYVPADKRMYGYFCLPLLLADKLVGRMDCKAHRSSQHFEIRALHLEPHAEQNSTLHKLGEALPQFLAFQNCHTLIFSEQIKQAHQTAINSAYQASKT